MKKYWASFVLQFNNAIEYRGATLSWLVVELLSLTTSLFLWAGAYQNRLHVGTYAFEDILLYYYFIPIVGVISGSYISDWLPRQIKDGVITKDLIKPYSFLKVTVVNHLANRLLQALIKLPVYLIIGFYLFTVLRFPFPGTKLIWGLALAFFALGMHLMFDFSLTLLTFWFDDSWSLSLLKFVCFLILGGMSFPVNLAPPVFRSIILLLPFHLVYYLPTAIILGHANTTDFLIGLIKCLAWGFVFFLLLNYLWRQALRKYAAYGQ